MANSSPNRGAVAVRPPRKTPLRWVLPVAVILLALIVAVTALLLLNANDNGDKPGLDVKDDPGQVIQGPPPVLDLSPL